MTPQNMQNANIGFGLIGSAFSGISKWQQGKAEQDAYNQNANITEMNMRQNMADSEQKFSSLMGRQRSLYAKAGVDMNSGSPLLVLADTAMRESQEQQRIKNAGTSQAAMQRYAGQMAAFSGRTAGISTFLTGLNKAANDKYAMDNA